MAKYGKHRYVGDEGSNLMLGQGGFVELTSDDEETGNGDWVAVKCLGADSKVSATVYTGGALTEVAIVEGDMIFGPFKNVTKRHADGVLIIYYG